MRRVVLTLILISLAVSCSDSNDKETLDLTQMWGTYFGESFPEGRAEVFLKGLVDKEHSVQNFCFSKDGNEFYFVRTLLDNDSATIYFSRRINDKWTAPAIVSFSGVYNDTDPFIDSTNSRMYFSSDRPRPGEEEPWFDFNIWAVEKQDSVWGKPYIIEELNSKEDEYYPSVSNDGTIYFASAREGSEGYWDIYSFTTNAGVTKVDSPISTQYRDWDPYIYQNNKTILFVSDTPDSGYGSGDIYISRKTEGGSWGTPINLGNAVNTNDYEYCPRLSYDGKFLFFTRLEATGKDFSPQKGEKTINPFEYDYLPEAGRNVLYWISVDSLKVFRE